MASLGKTLMIIGLLIALVGLVVWRGGVGAYSESSRTAARRHLYSPRQLQFLFSRYHCNSGERSPFDFVDVAEALVLRFRNSFTNRFLSLAGFAPTARTILAQGSRPGLSMNNSSALLRNRSHSPASARPQLRRPLPVRERRPSICCEADTSEGESSSRSEQTSLRGAHRERERAILK